MGEFKHGTCGCLEDLTTCLVTYFLPCLTAGKNAEHVDENCLLYGIAAITCVGPITRALIRQKIREKYSIEGSLCNDIVCHFCCPVCSLAQESQEIQGQGGPGPLAMARE